MSGIIIDTGPSTRGAHRLERVARCPQLYRYRVEEEEKELPAEALTRAPRIGLPMPLVRGTLAHVGLAQFYARMKEMQRKRDPDKYEVPAVAVRAVSERFGDVGAEQTPNVTLMLAEYQKHYRHEPFIVAGVEVELRIIIKGRDGTKYLYTARIDLGAQYRDLKIWFVDHKAVGKIEQRTVDRYELSMQFLGQQILGHHHFGDRFGGVLLNLIEMGKGRFRYARPPVNPAPGALSKFERNVVDMELRIASLEQEEADGLRTLDEWPATFSELCCTHAYGACEYRERCRWGKAS